MSYQKKSDFIRSRSCFKDKVEKTGGDKITLYLGPEDTAELIEKLEKSNGEPGVRLMVFVTRFEDKLAGSLAVSESKGKGDSGGGGYKKKTYSYRPKKLD